MPVSTTHVISSAIMGVGSSHAAVGGPLGGRRQHRHRLGADHPRVRPSLRGSPTCCSTSCCRHRRPRPVAGRRRPARASGSRRRCGPARARPSRRSRRAATWNASRSKEAVSERRESDRVRAAGGPHRPAGRRRCRPGRLRRHRSAHPAQDLESVQRQRPLGRRRGRGSGSTVLGEEAGGRPKTIDGRSSPVRDPRGGRAPGGRATIDMPAVSRRGINGALIGG